MAIVGSGPAGFYTAKYLLKSYPNVRIDLIEQLPVPYGLVRFGVAPDHPEVKNVSNDFAETLSDARLSFMGNVAVPSPSLPFSSLTDGYDAVILAYGASSDRRLSIPGSGLRGVLSARCFVNWYNGHPHHRQDEVELTGGDVVVVGQGNVAIDCARIIVKGSNGAALQQTDIADHALQAMQSEGWRRVRRVSLVGRRGPVQSAFTIAEFRELSELPGVSVLLREEEMRVGEEPDSRRELEAMRAKRRKYELMKEVMQRQRSSATGAEEKEIVFRFLLNPVQYVEDAQRPGWVGGVRCERMRLTAAAPLSSLDVSSSSPTPSPASPLVAVPTGEYELLPASLVLESIGYKSLPIPSLPFDSRTGTIPSLRGRVAFSPSSLPSSGPSPAGVYVTGWLKRGPSGIIGSNIADAKETVASVAEDLRKGEEGRTGRGKEGLKVQGRVVDKQGWRRIEEFEREQGASTGRSRVKLLSVDEMLRVAGV